MPFSCSASCFPVTFQRKAQFYSDTVSVYKKSLFRIMISCVITVINSLLKKMFCRKAVKNGKAKITSELDLIKSGTENVKPLKTSEEVLITRIELKEQ